MQFSVIIPSRNRPEQVRDAIDSVISQTYTNLEVIVVNDGSDLQYQQQYLQIESVYDGRVKLINLEQSCKGHGPSYAINMGAAQASGDYLCFLDDDDTWLEPRHLEIAHNFLSRSNADIYFTNQRCYVDNEAVGKKIWLAPLEGYLTEDTPNMVTDDDQRAYLVNVEQLLKVDSFSHMNIAILKTALYRQLNGMDENIWYECERDFYYRYIDHADKILFNPLETSRHNIPPAKSSSNVSSLVSSLDRLLSRIRLLDKAILYSRHAALVRIAKKHKVYSLKAICENLYIQKQYKLAAYYAREVFFIGFTFKWSLFSLLIILKSFISKT
jgi:glycosyltransferase involved in cell wall biosynthesis